MPSTARTGLRRLSHEPIKPWTDCLTWMAKGRHVATSLRFVVMIMDASKKIFKSAETSYADSSSSSSLPPKESEFSRYPAPCMRIPIFLGPSPSHQWGRYGYNEDALTSGAHTLHLMTQCRVCVCPCSLFESNFVCLYLIMMMLLIQWIFSYFRTAAQQNRCGFATTCPWAERPSRKRFIVMMDGSEIDSSFQLILRKPKVNHGLKFLYLRSTAGKNRR